MTRPARDRAGSGIVINIILIVAGLIGISVLLLVQFVQGEEQPPEPLDLRVSIESLTGGFEAPVLLAGAGDGSGDRLVVEQRGTIRRVGPDWSHGQAFYLDIRERVLHHHERGLLGLALHPEHLENGRFYVLYSRRDDGATTLSEFTLARPAGAEAGDAPPVEDSERALLTIPQFSTMHKGGMLAFDAEGMLLLGIGDGSTGNDPEGNALDPASLLGKLLRLDVDAGYPYALPEDNGFAEVRGARPEVHALGLRNPWRFSVDAQSGHVYIGDVGQSDWEEIDVLAPGVEGASFGWADMEGHDCFYGRSCDPEAHIAPVVAYPHLDGEVGHCGVIGGYAYRGAAGSLPGDTYLYADYCSGTIWGVPAEQLRQGEAVPAVVGGVPPELGMVRSFGQDDEGELYLLTSSGVVIGISAADPD